MAIVGGNIMPVPTLVTENGALSTSNIDKMSTFTKKPLKKTAKLSNTLI